jgi:hypothetical protein
MCIEEMEEGEGASNHDKEEASNKWVSKKIQSMGIMVPILVSLF